MIDWHRLFGLALIDFFTYSPYQVELEKDLSFKQQFLDVVILRRTSDSWAGVLPDGLDNLAEHNLITYKSIREPLNAWAMKELIGHYVNYRKQISGDSLLPEKILKLYGVATRFPRKLSRQIPFKKLQPGVYQVMWGTDSIRIIVLNEIPKSEHNAMWHIFSGVANLIDWGAMHYHTHTPNMSTVINQLFDGYRLEGVNVSYTVEDFQLDITRQNLHLLSPMERLRGLPPEERLRGLPTEERLRGVPPEEILSGLSAENIARLKALLQ